MGGNLYDETLDSLDDAQQPPSAQTRDPLYDDATAVLREQDAAGETRMRQAFHGAASTTPDRAAESRRLALTFGVPAPVIERNFDEYAKRDQVEQPYQQMQRQTPHTAAWLQEDNNAALAKDDLAKIGALEWLVTAPQRAFQQGIDQYKGDQLRYQSIFRDLTQAERDQLNAFDYNAKKGGALGADGSWFRRAVAGGIEQLPLLGGAMLMGAKYGVAGAATTATVGAGVGALEGGVGAIPGAAAGWTAGLQAGTFYGTFRAMGELSAGQAYARYSQMRDESGQPLDPRIAKAAALGTGVINGLLGSVGLEKLVEKIPGVDKLTGAVTRSLVEQALKVPTVRAALLRTIGSYAANLGTQATVAVGMEAANILGGEIAKQASGQPFAPGKPEDVFADLVHQGIGALQDFSILSAVGPAFELAHGIREASVAQHNADYFAALGDAARDSKTVGRAPEAVRDLLQRATERGPVESVYAPVDAWTQYWQSKNVDPSEMARRVTGEPDALEQAQQSGTDLKIPTARYATTLAPTEHNAFFARELRLDPNEMNAREAEAFLAEAQKAPAEAPQPPTAREQVRQQIFDKLVAASVPANTAEHYARLVESGVGTMAESAGLDPFEVFQRYGVDVRREGLDEAAATPDGPVDEQGRALGGYAGPERRTAQAGPPDGVEERRTPNEQVRLDLQNPELRKAAAQLEARARDAHANRTARPRSTYRDVIAGTAVDNAQSPEQNPEGYFNVAARSSRPAEEGAGSRHAEGEQPHAHAEGAVEGTSHVGGAQSRRLQAHEPRPDEAFVRASKEEVDARLTPDVRRELGRIVDEMETFPYVGRTWTFIEHGPKTGNAAGGAADIVAGHGGASVHGDILAFAPRNARGGKMAEDAHGTNSQILNAARTLLRTGELPSKNANLAEGALRVAENRAGDFYEHLSAPELPPSWGREAPERLVEDLSAAIDDAVAKGEANEDDLPLNVDTSFEPSEFGQGLFDALDEAILEPEKADTLDTGEVQPRLPGAEDVRDQNIATPEFEAPFSLTPPENKGPKGKQQTLFQERRGSIQIGPDRQVQINLFARADLSTFLHETGHFFLEVFGDLADKVGELDPATLTDSQRRLLADYGAVLTELGVENRREVTTEQHERFARMFETYLFEGKAPSLELRSTFARFRAWLLGVYRELRNLKAPLTDDVRGVFDRMLASDKAIKDAEASGRLDPLFTTPESAGMSPEEFGLYRAHVADASRRAKEELDAKLLSEVRRTQEADYKAKRETVRGAVEQQMHAAPVYQALAAMRRGTNPDGSPLVEGVAAEPLKLSRQILVERYGEDRVKTLPKPFIYSREGGLDPDFVAQRFGFSSGDELLRAVEASPSMADAIEQETTRRMQAQYGSMLLDGTLPEQAELAAANDHREAVIRAELRALWSLQKTVTPFVKAAVDNAGKERDYERRWFEAEAKLRIAIAEGRKQADIDRLEQHVSDLKAQARGGAATIRRAMPSAETLRTMAQQRIAGTRVADLEPALFWSAARRAAQNAVDAAARQEFDHAITSKTSELVNLALFKEAERAKEDVTARVAKIRELSKGPARARIGLAGDAYLDQVDGILDRYDFAKASEKVLDRRASIQKFVEGLQSEGLPVDLPDEVLNDARRVHYSRLTYEELVGVSDGLNEIAHLARLKNRLLKIAEKRELRATAETLTASIAEHATTDRTNGLEVRGPGTKGGRNIEQFFASHRKLGSIVRQMDGFQDGGFVWEHILRPLNEAADAEAVRNEEATVALRKIFTDAYKGEETSLYHRQFIPAINDSLSKMARLMIALNWGNDGNRDRIRNGYHWSDDQVRSILGTLDARDGRFVQAILDHIETYWPDIEAKQKRVFGVAPEKVAPAPFEVGGEPLRGGYFPIKYEHQLSARAAANLEASFADGIKQAAYVQATTQRGHTKARAARVSEPVRLDFGVITDHIQQVIHDLTHHETLIDVGRLLAQRDVQDAVYTHYGDITYDQLKGAVRDIAFGNSPAPGWYQTLNAIRAKTVTATLGWNAITSLLHTLQLTRGMVRVGPGWVAQGLVRWAVSARNAEESAGWIESQSDMMRLRWKTQQRELNEVRNQVGLDRGKVSAAIHDTLAKVGADPGAMPAIADSYFYAIRKIVQIAEIPTWIGAYEKAMADETNDHARSVALADQAVIDSMGSGHIKDLSAVQRAPMAKLLTTFYDYHNSVYNQAYEVVKSDASLGKKLVDASLLLFVPVAFAAAVHHATGSKKTQDQEKRAGVAKTLGAEGVDYALGMWVGLRELSGAFTGRDYEGPAGMSFVPTFRNFLYRVGQEGSDGGRLTRSEKTVALAKSGNEVAGELFGYPARQVERTANGLQALWQGKTHNPSALLFGPENR